MNADFLNDLFFAQLKQFNLLTLICVNPRLSAVNKKILSSHLAENES